MKSTKWSAPWFQYVQKLRAMFGKDPDISIVHNEGNQEVTLLVTNPQKADALMQLLPAEKEFGNVTLKITVKPANDVDPVRGLLLTAFAGSPVLREINVVSECPFAATYAMFKKEVVDYYSDNMSDPEGMSHTLYQDIAKDIFVDLPGVFFSTAGEDYETCDCCCCD